MKNNISTISILRDQGNLDLAEKMASQTLESAFSIDILSLLIDILVDKRKGENAINLLEIYSDKISSQPLSRELMGAHAKALLATGKQSEALELFHQTTLSFPKWADGWNNYGCCLRSMSRYSEAIPKLKQALILDNGHIKAALSLSTIYKGNGNLDRATEVISQCLETSKAPELIEALVKLFHQSSDHDQALLWAKKLTEGQNNQSINQTMLLARSYFLCGDTDAYVQTLRGRSETDFWNGLSVHSIAEGVAAECGIESKVGSRIKDILKKFPADPNCNLALSREKLRQYDLISGWRHYSHRINLPNPQFHFNQKVNWDGTKFEGKNILIVGEQGIGDISYFSRFLPPLLESTQNVSMLCEERMQGFLQSTFPNIYFFSDPLNIEFLSKPLIKIAIGSLPLMYGNTIESIYELGQKSPLKPNQQDQNIWSQRLKVDSGGRPTIGISLLGGRAGDEFQQKKRNLPIKKTLELFKGKNIALVDLQHHQNESASEINLIAEELNLTLLQYTGLTDDISQLIAVMACLDGLVTAQQTNAHLAGSLGLRGLVALPVVAHFVYGFGETTPWYPSLQLVRSDAFGEWDSCIDSLGQKINNWLLI